VRDTKTNRDSGGAVIGQRTLVRQDIAIFTPQSPGPLSKGLLPVSLPAPRQSHRPKRALTRLASSAHRHDLMRHKHPSCQQGRDSAEVLFSLGASRSS
jgi:hypothetical protein